MSTYISDPPSTIDFEEADFLDLAHDYGTIVETDPDKGVMGFASFSYDEFLEYSRALVVETRNDVAANRMGIHNTTDLAIADAVILALGRELVGTYGVIEPEWPDTDEYVTIYRGLLQAVFKYRQDQWRAHAHESDSSITTTIAIQE